MSPKSQDIAIHKGATFSLVLEFEDDAKSAFDFTGYTGTARYNPGTTGSSKTAFTVTLGGAAGTATVTMLATDTATLTSGSSKLGTWDLVVTSASETLPLARGTARLVTLESV